jgi:hypothetical protein
METVVKKIKDILSIPKTGIELILLSLLILSKSIIESHRTPNESETSPKTSRELYSNPAAIKLGRKLSENVNISDFVDNVHNSIVSSSNLSPEEISSSLKSIEISNIYRKGLKSIMFSMITPQSQLGICDGYLNYLIGLYSDDRDRFKRIINENKLVIIGLFKTIIMATYVSKGGDIKSRKKNGRTMKSQKKFRKLKIQHGGNVFIDYLINSLNSGTISPMLFGDDVMFNFLRNLNLKFLTMFSTILTFIMMNDGASNSHNKTNKDTILKHGHKTILKIEIIKYHLDITLGVDSAFYFIDKASGTIRKPSDKFDKLQTNALGENVIVKTSFSEELQKAGLTKLYHTLLLLTLVDNTLIVIEKNPAVDIYSITQNHLDTKLKTKNGFESYLIKQFISPDMMMSQPDDITGWNGMGNKEVVYIPNSRTFSWLINETEQSVDKNTYFNYRLFGAGTCQNFVNYFIETLARNAVINGIILNRSEIFYVQSVCRLETLMIQFVGREIVPVGNIGQTSFFLLIIGKRQLGDLLSKILDYAYENIVNVKILFDSPTGINAKKLLLFISSLIASIITIRSMISQGGYSSKSRLRNKSKNKSKLNNQSYFGLVEIL